MGKFYNIFKNENIIDLNNNDLLIEELKINLKERMYILSFVFDTALTYNEYKEVSKFVKNYFKKIDIIAKVNISYKNNSLLKEDYITYYQEILNILIESSSSYVAFQNIEIDFFEDTFNLVIEQDALGLDDQANAFKKEFENYGLLVNFNFVKDETKSIEQEIKIQTLNQMEEIERKQQEAVQLAMKNQVLTNEKKKYGRNASYQVAKISEIPNTPGGLSEYSYNVGECNFRIEGEVFSIDLRKMKTSTLASIKITDETDSILVKKWLRSEEEIKIFQECKTGDIINAFGVAEFDTFAKDVVLNAKSIEFVGVKKEEVIEDNAQVKRVELHCHTKMSTLDGISEAKDYIDLAKKWGHKAIAITDHGGVHAIPDISHIKKTEGFKNIFGSEFNYIDDEKYFITFNKQNIDLKNASYVIFDIETTGLSENFDKIIEIAAIKVQYGQQVASYETFVNPEIKLSKFTTELTSIKDEDVINAPKINEVIYDFIDFCKGSILVAHNAEFDVNFIYSVMRQNQIEKIDFPVIDTLSLARALYNKELKRFGLKYIAKFFKVKQEQHHRAIDDTLVTSKCFILMLQDIYKRQIYNYEDINNLINKEEFYKLVFPKHLNVIAKTQTGYKNLFKMVSDSLTNHCYGEGRLLKSILLENKEGTLVGSGCYNSEIFQTALYGNRTKLASMMEIYDYIEVQPLAAYNQYIYDNDNGLERIKDTICFIIDTAKSINKIVVATSDCHYTRPNLKKYRDILIASPQIGGGVHDLERASVTPEMHFRTTNEMLNEFAFLDKELAYEIVVTNTNLIADMIEEIECYPKQMFTPADDEFKDSLGVASIVEEMKKIVSENTKVKYGETPHLFVKKRIDRELNSIISNGFSSVYYMSYLLVSKSLSDGYLVGSRGSVGSSLVATMMNITEINPLSPHYICKECKFQVFKMNEEEKELYKITELEKEFQPILDSVESGYDLPDHICPICGANLSKDGHDIPFETFLGFNGDKVPDIDLNFSGEYQAIAHEYVRTIMGEEHSFRSGTVASIQDKNAYGYVKGYCEKKNLNLRACEIERIAQKLVGTKRSTGQHPGGIIVVPKANDIYDVTPIQYPADNIENSWRTTHFDYHSFEDNLLKLDILGHDDPTLIKYFMDYVNLHQDEFPFKTPQDIPLDDKKVFELFYSTNSIGVTKEDINSEVASYAVPEFGTNFVRQMLVDTLPKTFAELVKISGLSHGTDVWLTNAQDLVLGKTEFGTIGFSEVIGCRDDIMVYLMYQGLEPIKAFEIMEFVRKGKVSQDKVKWEKYKAYMEEKNVPKWYIWSCERIKYMFPKAHATAYVLMAIRIAWFKVHSPALFYSAWFSKRAKAHSVKDYLSNVIDMKKSIITLSNKMGATVKDEDLITSLNVAIEMVSRNIKFLPVDIFKSDALTFTIEDGNLRIPFIAVDGLGENAAIDIVSKRNEKLFTSKKDIMRRTKLNQTLFELFEEMESFGNLLDEDETETLGLFAFM